MQACFTLARLRTPSSEREREGEREREKGGKESERESEKEGESHQGILKGEVSLYR